MLTGLVEPGHTVAVDRYFLKNTLGESLETYEDLCRRVAKAVAQGEPKESQEKWEALYFQRLFEQTMVCGGRFFANAGTHNQQFPNCFIDAIEDSKESIWGTLQKFAITLSGGGGQGANFSNLRSRGMPTSKSKGVASGPVSFIKLYDASGEVIVQGGSRRAAHMGVLYVDHPDILEFIMLKDTTSKFRRFNISVGIFNSFMENLSQRKLHQCYEPYLKMYCHIALKGLGELDTLESRCAFIRANFLDRLIVSKRNDSFVNLITNHIITDLNTSDLLSASDVFHLLCYKAWECGDPGVLFLDKINDNNPFIPLERPTEKYRHDRWYFRASNPCAEEQMGDGEICMLGHLVVTKFLKDDVKILPKEDLTQVVTLEDLKDCIDLTKVYEVCSTLVRFLDTSIDVSDYPSEVNKETAQQTRRIGLGTLGWADLFLLVGIRYGSPLAVQFADWLMSQIARLASVVSEDLGKEKGSFPLFEKCQQYGHFVEFEARRNSLITTMAPTGTTSMIVGTFQPGEGVSSSGEPNFAFSYIRKDEVTPEGREIFHPLAKKWFEIHNVKTNLQSLPSYFVTAQQVPYQEHINMLDALQRHIDSGVSKTNNMPQEAKVEDVKDAFMQAYESSVKSFTVYRDKSKEVQVLNHPEAPTTLESFKSLLKRSFVLEGKTYKISTGDGNLFVTINTDSIGPCEIFLTIGRQGSNTGVFAEALGRIISKGLQTCFTFEDRINYLKIVEHQLADLQGPTSGFDGTFQANVKSIPDALSKILNLYVCIQEPPIKIDSSNFSIDEENFIQQQYCPKGNC